MGCFEDFMQFRDEVEEAKKKVWFKGRANEHHRGQDLAKKEEDISKTQSQ